MPRLAERRGVLNESQRVAPLLRSADQDGDGATISDPPSARSHRTHVTGRLVRSRCAERGEEPLELAPVVGTESFRPVALELGHRITDHAELLIAIQKRHGLTPAPTGA